MIGSRNSSMPERRLVERLVYPDQAAADAARARLDAGESFETLVADRG
jgi:peptidyl-prolyl cis-trans isomerase D